MYVFLDFLIKPLLSIDLLEKNYFLYWYEKSGYDPNRNKSYGIAYKLLNIRYSILFV